MNKISLFLMAAIMITMLTLLSGCGTIAKKELTAEEKAEQVKIAAALPFGVSIGGKKAQLNSEFCAKIAEPVKNTAEILVDAKTDDIVVITILPSTPEGIAKPRKKQAVIAITEDKKSSLDKADTGKLKPGFYVMNVNVNNVITSVVFEIKK